MLIFFLFFCFRSHAPPPIFLPPFFCPPDHYQEPAGLAVDFQHDGDEEFSRGGGRRNCGPCQPPRGTNRSAPHRADRSHRLRQHCRAGRRCVFCLSVCLCLYFRVRDSARIRVSVSVSLSLCRCLLSVPGPTSVAVSVSACRCNSVHANSGLKNQSPTSPNIETDQGIFSEIDTTISASSVVDNVALENGGGAAFQPSPCLASSVVVADTSFASNAGKGLVSVQRANGLLRSNQPFATDTQHLLACARSQ